MVDGGMKICRYLMCGICLIVRNLILKANWLWPNYGQKIQILVTVFE
jgi:hypothetical protein